MGSVYTVQIANAAEVPGGSVIDLPQPPGVVTVVRDVSATVNNGPDEGSSLEVLANGTGFIILQAVPDVIAPLHWQGRVLVPESGLLQVSVTGVSTAWDFIITGYHLSLP